MKFRRFSAVAAAIAVISCCGVAAQAVDYSAASYADNNPSTCKIVSTDENGVTFTQVKEFDFVKCRMVFGDIVSTEEDAAKIASGSFKVTYTGLTDTSEIYYLGGAAYVSASGSNSTEWKLSPDGKSSTISTESTFTCTPGSAKLDGEIVFMDWSKNDFITEGVTMTVSDFKVFDKDGNEIATKPYGGVAAETEAPVAEETTPAETEAPAETTTETTVETPDEPEADEDDGTNEDAIDEEPADEGDEEYVSTFDPSSVKLADTVTDKYFDGTYLYLRDENGLDALDKGEGLDVTSVYGVRFLLDYDDEDVANGVWFGGGIGANSNSTGWKQFGWSYTEGEQDLTMDLDTKSITWLSDAPVFQADDTYCQLWLQNWGGNWGIKEVQMLDASGNAIVLGASAPAAQDTTPAPAPAAGDVAAAADSSKGSPDTGVADVAAVAGLAVVAAGAVIVAKKRK